MIAVQIRVLASAIYPLAALPRELAQALEQEIRNHMEAYGFKEVLVEVAEAK